MKISTGETPQGEHPAVQVHCYPSPLDHSIVISCVTAFHEEGRNLMIVKIVERVPMAKDMAISKASEYAERWGLAQIYLKDDTASRK